MTWLNVTVEKSELMILVSHRTAVDAGGRSRARRWRTRRQRTQRTRILEHGGFWVLPESAAFLSCFLPFIETDYKERRSQRQPVHRALVRPSPHPRCRARPRSQARGRASPAPRPPKCAANHRLVLGTCKTEKETCLSFATNPAQELLTKLLLSLAQVLYIDDTDPGTKFTKTILS